MTPFTITSTPGGKSTPVGSAQTIAIANLGARSISLNGTSSLEVMITIHGDGNRPIPNAQVTGSFRDGYDGTGSCITDNSGVCRIVSGSIAPGIPAVTFTITGINHSNFPYDSSKNHDLVGQTAGTTITIPIS